MIMEDSIDYSDIEEGDIMIEVKDNSRDISAIFEQNNRVAYAYLLLEDTIVSDVWLYNIDYSPELPEWKDSSCEMPFRNAAQYVWQKTFQPINKSSEVAMIWIEEQNVIIGAEIFVRDELLGVLLNGHKPGWSKLALVDNPIAKSLSENQKYNGNSSRDTKQ
jgi:hypothetical protein